MTDPSTDAAGTGPDRRSQADRRKYNRRRTEDTVAPPYYEAFERIALALEGIEQVLEQSTRTVDLRRHEQSGQPRT